MSYGSLDSLIIISFHSFKKQNLYSNYFPAATACDATKLSFNGGYRCHGDGDSFTCSLTCPAGTSFSSAPAQEYTCLYSTGRFEPQPLPRCLIGELLRVFYWAFSEHHNTDTGPMRYTAHRHLEIR